MKSTNLLLPYKKSRVNIVGFGTIGKRVAELAIKGGIPINFISNSKGLFQVNNQEELLKAVVKKKNLNEYSMLTAQHNNYDKFYESLTPFDIVVDTSASLDTLPLMKKSLNKYNASLVFANKKPLADSSYVDFKELNKTYTKFEATVGAGLPIIETIQRNLNSFDEYQLIQGQLSGTLGYLLSSLDDYKNVSFSQVVSEAEKKGYTEPDPRDDLGGTDVARKAVILARLAFNNSQINLDQVEIEKLYPDEFSSLTIDEFRKKLPELDAMWKNKCEQADKNNSVLRYTAEITKKKIKVGIVQVNKQKPLALLKGTLNLVSLQSKYYPQNQEMVISGPGAGIDVTAAAVFSDVVELSKMKNLN